ncbi:MAG: hypothetical protein KGN02_04865 [bacterium]|nr:hypothetical protein [bacterium]
MPVSIDTQAAIAQRYSQLAEAMQHGDTATELRVLSPNFKDRAPIKLASFELDPLAVMVERIVALHDGSVEVHARYVGWRGHNADAVDRWVRIAGTWRLASHR